jgi:site-specific DNA-methyltransferase (adenine-specific)
MWELFEGDCLEIMPTLPDKSVDMILCDLPYGTTACKWDTVIPFAPLWEQYSRLIKDNGAIVLTAVQPFAAMVATSKIEWLRYEWVWVKPPTLFQHAKNRPMTGHENILVFSKAGWGHASQMGENRMIYNPQGVYSCGEKRFDGNHGQFVGERPNQVGKHYESFEGYPSTVIKINRDFEKIHPTQKPVALFEYLIKTYTNPGDTILDNCAGSGTTAIAAEQSGRNSILIEREPKYCDIIRKRMADFESARQGCLSF